VAVWSLLTPVGSLLTHTSAQVTVTLGKGGSIAIALSVAQTPPQRQHEVIHSDQLTSTTHTHISKAPSPKSAHSIYTNLLCLACMGTHPIHTAVRLNCLHNTSLTRLAEAGHPTWVPINGSACQGCMHCISDAIT